jgi:NDP-sugar pyrophosphorylase family protein
MKAMILAAGLGTRLGELTRERPKALVELQGRTLLEITLGRLRSFGIMDVMINVHHFADMVVEYLRAHDDFGMRIAISKEDELLDTGGGLKKAEHFFLRDVRKEPADEPFVLHNVDVLSAIDIGEMVKAHRARNAVATLAVQQRTSSRALLFDEQLALCGWRHEGGTEMARPAAEYCELAFAGIHVISPRIFRLMDERLMDAGGEDHCQDLRVFSIIPEYLRMAGEGETIAGFRADGAYWRDLGTPESLRQAGEDVAAKVIGL